MAAPTLLAWEAAIFTLATVVHAASKHGAGWLAGLRQAAGSAALVAFTAALSPLYATLTASISSDTVVACTSALLLAHLYLHEYQQPRHAAPSVSGSLGLACALCASVLMASQMRTLEDVFALVSCACGVYLL